MLISNNIWLLWRIIQDKKWLISIRSARSCLSLIFSCVVHKKADSNILVAKMVIYLMCFFVRLTHYSMNKHHIDGLAQDCNNSIANSLELLQSCTKPLILASWYNYDTMIYHV